MDDQLKTNLLLLAGKLHDAMLALYSLLNRYPDLYDKLDLDRLETADYGMVRLTTHLLDLASR